MKKFRHPFNLRLWKQTVQLFPFPPDWSSKPHFSLVWETNDLCAQWLEISLDSSMQCHRDEKLITKISKERDFTFLQMTLHHMHYIIFFTQKHALYMILTISLAPHPEMSLSSALYGAQQHRNGSNRGDILPHSVIKICLNLIKMQVLSVDYCIDFCYNCIWNYKHLK